MVDDDKIKIKKKSKSLAKVKKGDIVKIDGKEYEVEAHYVLIAHGNTKENAIDVFDPIDEKEELQIRYFSDRIEESIEIYKLEEIMYMRRPTKQIEW